MEKYKCILSLRVAKSLVGNDHRLVDIQPSKKLPGKLVFVFLNSGQLEMELSKFKIEGR